jgi:hypothetical protein
MSTTPRQRLLGVPRLPRVRLGRLGPLLGYILRCLLVGWITVDLDRYAYLRWKTKRKLEWVVEMTRMRRRLSWHLERGERNLVSACRGRKGANFGKGHKECSGVLRSRGGRARGKLVGIGWCRENGER